MALKSCAECGKQISDKAASCPHCGAPVLTLAREARKTASFAWNAIRIAIALVFGVIVYNSCQTLNRAHAAVDQAHQSA